MNKPLLLNAATVPSNSAVSYYPITPVSSGLTWAAATTSVKTTVQKGFSLSDFIIESVGSPGVGKSYQFVLQKNGNDTALDATLSGAQTLATASTNTPVYYAPGDTIYLKCTPSGTPTALTNLRWSFRMDTRSVYDFWLRGFGAYSTSAQSYYPIKSGALTATSASTVTVGTLEYVSTAGTIKEFYATTSVAPGVGKSIQIDIYRNNAAEGTATLTISGTSTTASVTGLNIAYAAGDTFSISVTPSGTPAAGHLTTFVCVIPAVDGETTTSSATTALNTGVTQWTRIGNSFQSINTAADTNPKQITPINNMFYYRKYNGKIATAPGVGKSWDVKMRVNSTNVNNDFTISGASTTGSDLTNVDGVYGSKNISNQIVPSGTPAASANCCLYSSIFCHPRILII